MAPAGRGPAPRLSQSTVLFSGLLLVGCGGSGGSPSLPSAQNRHPAPPPIVAVASGTILTFVSAETERPVAGARVTVGGAAPRTYSTDASGRITLGEARFVGDSLEVAAEGFLDRRTLFRSATELSFTLWPRANHDGLTEQVTAELAYTPGAYCCPAEGRLGSMPLRRPRSGVILQVSLASSLRTDFWRKASEWAIDMVNAANAGRVLFEYVESPASGASPGPRLEVVADAQVCGSPTAVACFDGVQDSQGYLVGGRIVLPLPGYFEEVARFWGPEPALVTLAHEMGHASGLQHSTADGIMCVRDGSSLARSFYLREGGFSRTERLMVGLLHARRAGNAFPDDDTRARSSDGGGSRGVTCTLTARDLS